MSNPQPVANDGPFARRTTQRGDGFASRLRQTTTMNRMLGAAYGAPEGTTIGGGGLRPYGRSNTFASAPMQRVALDPIATRSIGTQTDRSGISLVPNARNTGPLAAGGTNYLSFLQKVYGADSESELVKKFQKELGLEQQGLYKKPVMYRQSTQIMKGLGISRDKCHYGNAMFS